MSGQTNAGGSQAGVQPGQGTDASGGQGVPEQPRQGDLEDVAPPVDTVGGPSPLAPVGAIERAVDALERQRRQGGYDPKMLADLGWTPQQADEFVRTWRRLQDGSQGQLRGNARGAPDRRRAGLIPGDSRVQTGKGVDQALRRSRPAEVRRGPDQLQDVIRRARQQTPAAYRRLLEAYYQSISSADSAIWNTPAAPRRPQTRAGAD